MTKRRHKLLKFALALAGTIFTTDTILAEQEKESFVQDYIRNTGTQPFYFGRISFSIKAPNPVVDWDSVKDYAALAEQTRFYIGRVDANKRLIWLETWRRNPLSRATNIIVDGRPLLEHDVPVRLQGNRIISQTPLFFMQGDEDAWERVPVEATQGKTRFIRLRWLQGLQADEPVSLVAEFLEQRPEIVESYVYDTAGHIAEIYRQDETGQMQRVPQN